jgi:hypothetical protein
VHKLVGANSSAASETSADLRRDRRDGGRATRSQSL